MIVKLLTEHHLKFLILKGGYTGSSESTLVKMSNCWKSHAAAKLILLAIYIYINIKYDQEMTQSQTNPQQHGKSADITGIHIMIIPPLVNKYTCTSPNIRP